MATTATEARTRRRTNHQQRADVLSLHVAGCSQAEIARRLGISRQRAHQLLHDELRRLTDERHDLAEAALELAIQRANLITRAANEVVSARCRTCRGLGVLPSDETSCPSCKATGYAYPVEARLKAADRLLKANDQVSRLTGLYKLTPPTALTPEPAITGWRAEVAKMSDAELDAMLPAMAAPLSFEPIS